MRDVYVTYAETNVRDLHVSFLELHFTESLYAIREGSLFINSNCPIDLPAFDIGTVLRKKPFLCSSIAACVAAAAII
jgi:hypothetical protein